MGKNKTFKCPHCREVITMSELEIKGFDAIMNIMPGPRLIHPEGTVPCKSCDKSINIKGIQDGKYNVVTLAQRIRSLIFIIAIIAVVVYILF